MKKILTLLITTLIGFQLCHAADAPKKLLMVTVTTEFRHSASIPVLEKVVAQLGKDSGAFTVDFVQQPPGKPGNPQRGATDADRAANKEAVAKWNAAVTNALLKLSPENLKNYDGVIFASTTGDLPIPDKQGLLDWIKAGHAFIGIHAATDTFHHWPGYLEMIGGEFANHGAQVGIECLNEDPQHPATASLGKTWTITQEEVYQFKNYNPTNVHELLYLDKRPQAPFPAGHYAVSWCKDYGKGKVFYTSLGHREDIIDTDPELKGRINSVEISKAYQAHVLGGIKWALK